MKHYKQENKRERSASGRIESYNESNRKWI